MSEAVEASGATVEEAIDRALEMLGATDDEVEVEILAEPGGVVRRASEARVRVKFRDERTAEDLAFEDEDEEEGAGYATDLAHPDEGGDATALGDQADAASQFVRGLVDLLALDAEVRSSIGRDAALVELHGPELGLLIGRHGSTLDALQEITRAAVQRQLGSRAFVNLDVEGYRARRKEILERKARSVAAKVRRSGKPQELEPMSAFERKVVHDALSNFRGIETSSEGDDPYRHVVISPT